MTATKVWSGGAWVSVGGALTDQFVGALLADGVDTSTSVRASVTATGHATPFTDGTYAEVDASLSAAAAGIFIVITASSSSNAADTSTVLEIATGAAASEVPWASVAVGYRDEGQRIWVPGFIASGTRVAVRVRSAVTIKAVTAFYSFLPATKSIDPGAPVTMGYNPAAARGVTVTAPGSTNTKGNWVEIEDVTTADFGNLVVCPQAAGNTTMNNSGVLLDIGIGAAAAETVLIPDIYMAANGSESLGIRSPLTYGVNVPAGSRLSARYARANAANSLDVFLVGA